MNLLFFNWIIKSWVEEALYNGQEAEVLEMQRHNIDILAKLRQRMSRMLGKSQIIRGLDDNMLSTQVHIVLLFFR